MMARQVHRRLRAGEHCTMCLELMLHGIPDGVAGLAVLQLRQALHLACVARVLLQRLLRPLRQRLQSEKMANCVMCQLLVFLRRQSAGLHPIIAFPEKGLPALRADCPCQTRHPGSN